MTETKDNFRNRPGTTASPDKKTLRDLPNHHFGFGNDEATNCSEAKSNFIHRPITADPKDMAAVKKACADIKKHNIDLGTSSFTPIPQYSADFQHIKAEKVQESDAKKNLRKHNVAFGTDTMNYETT